MTSQPLKYLSDRALSQLRLGVGENLERYRTRGFDDLAGDLGWDISLRYSYDVGVLAQVTCSSARSTIEDDRENSLLVGRALANLTPALANEERIWARLAHLEMLPYSRNRWLRDADDDQAQSLIETHFFAPTQTGVRDDHAVARLWWNYHIAAECLPGDVERALGLILSSADTRSNFVERIWMTSRRPIASAVLRRMDQSAEWRNERVFREFMKTVNRHGGGIVFEALTPSDVDDFVSECFARATSS